MLSGYLSPDGTFYNAPSYSHMSSAQQEWLQNHYEEFTSNQKLCCDRMIKDFGDPFKFAKEVLHDA